LILAKQRTRDAEAKGLFIKAVELDPDMAWSYYSIACIDALEGKKDEALKNLEVALEKGLKDKAHIEKDSDLDSLRKDKKYRNLMEKYLGEERQDQGRA
jgi:tetratricopeptide (TPR) repeat protein